MTTIGRAALTTFATILTIFLVAPIANAMTAPEPAPIARTAKTVAASSGVAMWQVIAIAVVAVVIGALGATLAQRTRRPAARSLTTA